MQSQSLRGLGDRAAAPDRGHLTLVDVSEGLHELAGCERDDVAGGVTTHLHRHGCHHGEGRAAVGAEGRRVADNPHIRSTRKSQELIDDEATRGSGLTEVRPPLRCSDTRGPDDRAGGEDLAVLEVHVALVHPVDRGVDLDRDTELLELLLGVRARLLGEGRQEARTRLDQADGRLVCDVGVLTHKTRLEFGDRSAHLDSRGSATDHDDTQGLSWETTLLHLFVGIE